MRCGQCISLFCLALILILVGCAPIGTNDPYYGNSNSGYGYGYDNRPSYGSGYGYDRGYNDRRERERLERERDRLEEERERLEDERRRHDNDRPSYRPAPPVHAPPVAREQCPSGYTPSENKCSVEERRRGCKDMRLPGGLGCVRR